MSDISHLQTFQGWGSQTSSRGRSFFHCRDFCNFGDLWRSLDHPKWFVLASFGSFNSQDPCDPTGGQSSCRCCRNCGEELSFDLRIDRRHVCHFLPVSQVGTWMYLGEYWIEWWIWLNMHSAVKELWRQLWLPGILFLCHVLLLQRTTFIAIENSLADWCWLVTFGYYRELSWIILPG